ncbi:MAG TPA: hypothetical protein VGM45_08790 [Gaiellaceae bacterium]|jgi:hypothetical protein
MTTASDSIPKPTAEQIALHERLGDMLALVDGDVSHLGAAELAARLRQLERDAEQVRSGAAAFAEHFEAAADREGR